jgi:O-antigen/teichoic acid export membrane protein
MLKKIVKNAGILFTANIISKALNFAYVVYLARYLGAEGFGIISFALAFGLIFGVFADFGLNPLSLREISRNKNESERYFSNVAFIKIILSITIFFLFFLIVKHSSYSYDTIYVIYLIGLSVIIGSFNNFIYALYQANEDIKYMGIGYILNSLSMLAGILAAAYFKSNIIIFAGVFLVSALIVLLYNLTVISYKFFKPKLSVDLKFWKKLIIEAVPFGLVSVFVIIYFKIDSVMLGIMKTQKIVGYYNASYRIIDVFTALFPSIIFSVVYPKMSAYIELPEKLKGIYIVSFKISLIIGLIVSLITVFFAHYFIIFIYGSGYHGGINSLKILVWAFFFICISSITSGLISSINKQRLVTVTAGIGAVINISLNFLLIPSFSLNGAAFATVITELVMFLIYFTYAIKFLKFNKFDVLSLFNFSTGNVKNIIELMKNNPKK